MARLQLNNVAKRYGNIEVLRNIQLDIADGEFIVLVGPSGCGKSTLLRMIAGLEPISAGDFLIDGDRMNDIRPRDRDIAMVFQSYALYPHMDVARNMGFSMEIRGDAAAARLARVAEAGRALGLDRLLERLPKALSGGQRQRVAMGRAIVRDPRAFLFDEPLSNLDAALRVEMRLEIARLHQRLGTTMVYVTHDQVEALTLADRIVVLNGGVIQQVGSPLELYERPANKFVAQFIGSPKMNILSGAKAAAYPAHHVGVRPEHLDIVGGEGGAWTGVAVHSESLGADSFIYLDIGDEELMTVRLPGTAEVAAGTTLSVAPKAQHYHLFDASGRVVAA